MGAVERIGPFPPLAAGRIAASLLNRHTAGEIAEAVTVLIDVLDLLGGDPEAEITDAEDDFAERLVRAWERPGCDISDPGEMDDEPEEDDHGGGNVTDEPHDPDEGV